MKDIPVFTSPHGIATLILREIPCCSRAHVVVHSALEGEMAMLLDECGRFCRMAGAKTVLVSADEPLALPHAYDLLELCCLRAALPPPEPPVVLQPVTEETKDKYLALYAQLFHSVPGASPCTADDLARAIQQEHVFFAQVAGQTAGLGQYTGAELRALGVLSSHRGLGRRLALTLCAQMSCETVSLQVSSANAPALRLYERLGFTCRRVISRWYALTEQ